MSTVPNVEIRGPSSRSKLTAVFARTQSGIPLPASAARRSACRQYCRCMRQLPHRQVQWLPLHPCDFSRNLQCMRLFFPDKTALFAKTFLAVTTRQWRCTLKTTLRSFWLYSFSDISCLGQPESTMHPTRVQGTQRKMEATCKDSVLCLGVSGIPRQHCGPRCLRPQNKACSRARN